MKRLCSKHCLLAVISLMVGVIWLQPAIAAVAPTVALLGEMRDGVAPGARLAVDAAGNLYATDALKSQVVKFDMYGRKVRVYSGFPDFANSVAVTPDGARLYVAGLRAVYVVNGSSGEVFDRLRSDASPSGVDEFKSVGEIDLDAAGFVFVVDGANVAVRVYGPDSLFKYQFGGLSSIDRVIGQLGSGKFRSIWSLAVDARNGEVYVADNQNYSRYYSQIQIFGLNGVYKRSMTQQSFGTPVLSMFAGMAFDDAGRGYYVDSMWGNVRVRNLPLGVFPTIGVPGNDYGQLVGPYDLIYEPLTKRLFVSNSEAAKLVVFGIDGGANPVAPKTNTAPGVPVVSIPAGDSLVASQKPLLSWQNAADEDGDVLTYDVRVVGQDGVVAFLQEGVAESDGGSSVAVSAALEENARFIWQVRANDGQAVSDWSAAGSFYVNEFNEPPAVSALLAPTELVLDGNARFVWTEVTDPDPFDTVAYRLEISASADFGSPLIAVTVNGAQARLGEQENYAGLVDGADYLWRVQTVDTQGAASVSETRSFKYDTTMLVVRANMPDARVYLGGNHAYAGQYVGKAPLELRDMQPGAVAIVVERSGFEAVVEQRLLTQGASEVVNAALRPAIAPVDHRARSLQAGGVKIVQGADVVPFAVDFNNDGEIDLLTADASGVLTLYPGVAGSQPDFGVGQPLALKVPAGAAPCVVDWDNDGKKDLLVGTGAGAVLVYLNTGSEQAPAFGDGAFLKAGGAAIGVGSSAVPAVIDLDNDGDKDLLVGAASGVVNAFMNVGSDAAPELLATESPLQPLSGNAAPSVVDWNADGEKDLLLATSQHIYVCLKKGNVFAPKTVLTVAEDLVGKNGQSAYLGERLRVFAYDADQAKGKDLLVGNAAGQVRVARANGKAFTATFAQALSDKFSQVRAATLTSPDAQPFLSDAEILAMGALAAGKQIPQEALAAYAQFTAFFQVLPVEALELSALLQ